MKKVWLVVALVALGALASNTFADVQNIRLSGDIRLRGYFLDQAGAAFDTGTGTFDKQQKGNVSFIEQRTRVNVEADLEDHVLVVVTLKAEGTWGADDQPNGTTGAGTGLLGGNAINRGFDVGIDEAYVQLNELFYTPATLKVGRQYLHYGHGLILSSVDQEYNFDAARLVLDYYPLTIDIVGAELVNNQPFSASKLGGSTGAANLLFVNARYEMTDSLLKNIEAYFGWIPNQNWNGNVAPLRTPPIAADPFAGNGFGNSSPMIVGLRSDLNLTEALSMWLEGVYEFGDNGSVAGQNNISAILANAGLRFAPKNVAWSPSLNANYTFASGGGGGGSASDPAMGRRTFQPWFSYVDGYNGYLFAPLLSNIHIFNVGASVKPADNVSLSVQGYYYLKADHDGFAGSDPNIDFGGLNYTTLNGLVGNNSVSQNLGWEIDGIVGYDYSKDVRLQLVYGVFIPGNGVKYQAPLGESNSAVAQEVRAELNVKF